MNQVTRATNDLNKSLSDALTQDSSKVTKSIDDVKQGAKEATESVKAMQSATSNVFDNPEQPTGLFGNMTSMIRKSFADIPTMVGMATDKIKSSFSGAADTVKNAIHGTANAAAESAATIQDRFDAASEHLKSLSSQGLGFGDADYDQTYQELNLIEKELAEYKRKLTEVDSATNKTSSSTHRFRNALNGCTVGIKNVIKSITSMRQHTQSANRSNNQFASGLSRTLRGMLIYRVIGGAIKALATNLWTCFKTNDQFASSLSRIKGNLLTAFQPVYEFVLPAVNALMDALVQITGYIAQFSAMLLGKSVSATQKAAQAQYRQVQALKDTSKAAKDAKKQLSDVDELHNATSNSTSGGDSSGAVGSPVFDTAETKEATSMFDSLKEKLQPVIDQLVRLKDAIAPFATFTFDSLKDFYNTFLVPLASWAVGEGLPRFITILDNMINQIDFGKLKDSLHNLWTALEPFNENIGNGMLWFFENVLSPLAVWSTNNLIPGIINSIADAINYLNQTVEGNTKLSDFLSSAKDSISTFGTNVSPIFNDLGTLILSVFDSFTQKGLPAVTGFASEASSTLGLMYSEIGKGLQTVWNDIISPVLSFFGELWSDLMNIINDTWKKYGKSVFTNVKKMITNVSDTLKNAYDKFLYPIISKIGTKVSSLWKDHLKPLLSKVLEMVAKLIECATTIFNKVISPIVNWLIDKLGPAFTTMYGIAIDAVGELLGGVIDAASDIMTSLGGIVDFITGVFSGDWEKAWNGIKDIFKGIWDLFVDIVKTPINMIIGLINGVMSAFTDAINFMINGVNKLSFDMPDFLGGAHVGFNIKTVTAPQIPKLATGTVVPANYGEFAAILGDNKRETEVVSPLSTIKQALKETMAELGGGSGGDINLTIELVQDGEKTFRVVKRINREQAKAGKESFAIV